jgi:hypothetical protein
MGHMVANAAILDGGSASMISPPRTIYEINGKPVFPT